MKPVLLGQAPARAGDGRPFSGPSGQKLCAVLGIDYYAGLANAFDLRNLISEVQMRKANSKGDLFPKDVAAENWKRMRETLEPGRIILAAGRSVSTVLSLPPRCPLFEPYPIEVPEGVVTVYSIPHPSGISHWWNSPRNVRMAKDFLIDVITR